MQAKAIIEKRSRIIALIREFFFRNGFIEVETPVRLQNPALELHIDAIPSEKQYLRTSPELHMKRLIAEGHKKIFQIGSCFRKGERGRNHNPEFTMLEWYRSDSNYIDILADTKSMITHVVKELQGNSRVMYKGTMIEMLPVWEMKTVADAFVEWAGWSPVADYNEDRFNMDLITYVEPNIPRDKPFILKDYPVQEAALAKVRKANPPVAERWELYLGGLEIANAFSELVDAKEQRKRFEECAKKRAEMGKEVYGMDEDFLSAMENGMPECAGAALGVDRLIMILTDSHCIDDVRTFV